MTSQDQILTEQQHNVLAVIEADLASYLARDKAAWEENWVQEERFQSIMECGTMQIARGYAEFSQTIFEAMDASPEPVHADVRLENVRIDVHGDLAWATFDEIVSVTSNPGATPNLSHNFRLLESDGDRWRILFHGCWAEPLRDIVSPALEVAENCQVIWMNGPAVERLKSFSGLTISNGTLRAAKPKWDAQLRETVARSHELTGFGKFNQAARDQAGSVSFPVVLGEDDDGTLLTCWVRIADGRVYVLFGETADLTRQIDIASVIFGWSQAQTDVVLLISKGHGLSDLSNALEISVNTARTHLRRVFEKAGVGSQIELLRLLVSFSI